MNTSLTIYQSQKPTDRFGCYARELMPQAERFVDPLQWGNGYSVYVAAYDREFVAASNVLILPDKCYAYIAQLAVTETFRDHGIGTAMIEHAIDQAAEAGCDVVGIQPTNFNNRRLYSRLDFDYDLTRDPGHNKMFLKLDQYSPSDSGIR